MSTTDIQTDKETTPSPGDNQETVNLLLEELGMKELIQQDVAKMAKMTAKYQQLLKHIQEE